MFKSLSLSLSLPVKLMRSNEIVMLCNYSRERKEACYSTFLYCVARVNLVVVMASLEGLIYLSET